MADLKPPFTEETARKKVKAAQAVWNSKDPARCAQAYTPTCIWRNRDSFFSGTEAIIAFLTRKWEREHNYRLRKELFAFTDDRIAVQFWYEYQDAEDGMRWKRCYGLEDWTFDRETGKMRKRMMSGNELLLGPDGNGEGRWFVDGVDVDATAAIKIVSKRSAAIAQSESIAAMDRNASLFSGTGTRQMPSGIEREVVIMKLIEHPNVISLYDVWENRGELYLVLEYVQGGELFHYVQNHGPLPEEEAVRLFRQIIAGLGYCHRFNICHRDLKPENILLDSWRNVKLADFGMAALQPAGHWLNTSCGSPHYAAPEIIYGRKYRGDKADIWSCGIILYALLTGYLPFDGGDLPSTLRQVKRGEYTIPPELSVEAADLIQRILQKRPEDRITMHGIWMHPLLKKYEEFHQAMSHHYLGPAPPLTAEDCGPPVLSRQEIDIDILRNLQTLWHGVKTEALIERVLNPQPTQERMFYNALIKFRNEQLENYQGQPLEYSASDYHHISRLPASVANRRKHARLPGGSRRQGQISTISSSKQPQSTPRALKSSATEESYDPFRSPRHIVSTPEVQYAQVTVHRKGSEANTKDVSETVPESEDAMKEEAVEDIECLPSSPFSIVPNKKSKASFTRSFQSRASHSSSRRVLHTTPTPRSASYKRNVLFLHHRNRSQGSMSVRPKKTRANASSISRQGSDCSIKSDADEVPVSDGCGSPLLPVPPMVVRGAGVTIKKCPQVKRVCDADIIWKDEARKVSHELSQICEEAFNGGSLSTGCTASIGSETPATSLSMVSAGDSQNQITASNIKSNQPSNISAESPKSYTATELAETRRKLIQHSTQDGNENVPGYLSAVINHLDRLIAQDRTRERGKRDKINDNGNSTFDPLQRSPHETGNLPIISEELSNSLVSENEMRNRQHLARHNSDSASSIRTKRQSHDGKATIRMVPHSSQLCLEEVKPLNIRKNRHLSNETHQLREESKSKDESSRPIRSSTRYASADSRQTRFLSELDPIQEVPKLPRGSDTKASENKKWSWFRNRSQGSTETKTKMPVTKPIQPSSETVIVHEINPSVDPALGEQTGKPKDMKAPSDNKKGGFFKKFMKKRHNNNFDNAATEIDFADTNPLLRRPVETDHSFDTEKNPKPAPPVSNTNGRSQNWFARVFQIKPATRVVALNTSKIKGRKDVLKLLREWKQFGMEEAHLDKASGVIRGRVGEVNCLRLRAVEFSAEFYTVLEHGRQANLSLVRFKQERGAASSFHKVVDTLEMVLKQRGLLVEDPDRAKKMARILDAFPNG
ncbi:uncharacterized protein CDV56_103438 [Aspergillus thermomutatus]|uniref:non-specific serine/threonine protein kinase n=1 Tax=Aspergillus thermomutatus TaxID=41047 RepID=A0A397GYG9_ASPTH|nr:uncharacterized protein CDV56_103438 [Aspergillus thermomutatus]RHZ55925.1 hypothetical protein CDV56_103438 [Aspergillus thermomutatus]